jgi:arylsulfatase A-like enzyme
MEKTHMARPNILIFMTDQQRGATVLSDAKVKAITPNLDRFREESVTFTKAFCPSPHCCPSRATFFSGLYPTEHGVWNNVNVGNTLSRGLNDGVRLWSEDLRDAGYRMHFAGKWHVSAEESPNDRGWDSTKPFRSQFEIKEGMWRNEPQAYEWERMYKPERLRMPTTRGEGQILREGYGTYTHYGEKDNPFNDINVTKDGIEALRNRPKSEEPWCHYIGVLGPHDPYFVPDRFLDMYDLDDIELPATFEDRMQDKPALYRRTRDRFDQLSEREHREAIRHYLAFCTFLDDLFGQVLQALEERGELENTMVVYCSDHGDYMAEHGLWCKGLPCFQAAYHVPAIVRWPERVAEPGSTVDEFVTLADFAPTILEAAGVAVDRRFAGQSLLPFLAGETPADWPDAFFTQSNGNELYGIQRSVMTRDWKYVYNGFDYDELYDLANDPGETVNLADSPEHKPTMRAMAKRLWQFAHDNRDTAVNSYIMVSLAEFGPGIIFEDNR